MGSVVLRVIYRLVMNLRNCVEPYLRIYLSGEGRIQRTHAVHQALYAALAAHDADQAEALAKDHLRQALDALLSNLPHVTELSNPVVLQILQNRLSEPSTNMTRIHEWLGQAIFVYSWPIRGRPTARNVKSAKLLILLKNSF